MITIPKNDYKPNEVIREEIVQDICNAFLKSNAWSKFAPYNTSMYRRRTNGLLYEKGNLLGFNESSLGEGYQIKKFSSKELNAAIKALVEAGWHIFYSDNGGWPYIKCSKYPHIDNAREIFEWKEFFDAE